MHSETKMLTLPIADTVFRVIDVETTGFDPAADRVVEVAAVDLLPSGELADPQMHLVNPGRAIPPAASAVHHITARDVDNAPKLETVIGDYSRHNVVYVAHNSAFDSQFLPMLPGPWLCTLRLARHLYPGAPGHSNQVLRYWLDLVELPEWTEGLMAHRALYDVAVTGLLLQQMLNRLGEQEPELRTLGDLLAYAERPLLERRLRFGKHRGERFEDVPTDYLQWMLRTDNWGPDVAHTVRHHLRLRAAETAAE